jgi:hypothetical protein
MAPKDPKVLYQQVHDVLAKAGVPATVLADIDSIFLNDDSPPPVVVGDEKPLEGDPPQ